MSKCLKNKIYKNNDDQRLEIPGNLPFVEYGHPCVVDTGFKVAVNSLVSLKRNRKHKWNVGIQGPGFDPLLHMNGLAQDCSNSIAKALELLQSCTVPWQLVYWEFKYFSCVSER